MGLIAQDVSVEAARTAAVPHIKGRKKENVCAKVGIFLYPEKKRRIPILNNEIKNIFFAGRVSTGQQNILTIKTDVLFAA